MPKQEVQFDGMFTHEMDNVIYMGHASPGSLRKDGSHTLKSEDMMCFNE